MAHHSKRLLQGRSLVDRDKLYSLDEAVEILCKSPRAKFDETVELAMRLGVDPRKAEENVRGTVSLPHGTGKVIRVVVFCKPEKAEEAKKAGADFVGGDDIVNQIQGGWMDFDAAVATPDMMGQVGKIGKLLGPRGLMPNPKVGTVTLDIGKAVEAIKSGRVEYRVEKAGIVHVGAGKLSFGPEKIKENLSTFIDAIVKAKPKTSKGVYLKTINVSSTMGPGIKVDAVPYRSV
ncbi:MAG: 50S ribosomal protein L1 [Deltaproteobacteria bacterium]|nr:50S ribosomal protein L1 [Deltaproteobacteria bacterium]